MNCIVKQTKPSIIQNRTKTKIPMDNQLALKPNLYPLFPFIVLRSYRAGTLEQSNIYNNNTVLI